MTNYINGRFLSQKASGVQRFAREIIKALDQQLAREPDNGQSWVLLAPNGTTSDLDLSTIKFETTGSRAGHVWEQIDLLRASSSGVLINLCNSGPVLHGNSFTIIHDAMVFRTGGNFSRAYRLWHKTLGYMLAKRSAIGTVSAFSRGELRKYLGVKSAFIVPNSCEHLANVMPSPEIVGKLGLSTSPFFLFVGNLTPNKNLKLAIEAMTTLGETGVKLVIVGSLDSSVFGSAIKADAPNVHFTGHLSDEEVVALYKNAVALVFPSLYEGFGIPPLEAMLHGCPVISSDIPPVKEVCGDAALYFASGEKAGMVENLRKLLDDETLRQNLIQKGHARAALFSWDRSATLLRDAISGEGIA